MTKNKKKPARKQSAVSASKPAHPITSTGVWKWGWIVLRPIFFVSTVFLLISANKGYDRLYEMNVVRLQKDMKKYRGMSYEEKMEKFLPQDYPFLSFVKQETPPDAIILSPPKEVWHPSGRNLGLGQWIHRKDYSTYFLYPRKIVIDDKKDRKNPLREKYTHVLIIDSWGYDKIPYQVSNPQAFTVLPVNR